VVGAVLVQNTAWSNVEKAIASLKRANLLHMTRLCQLEAAELAPHIRSAGCYNIKAVRLLNLLSMLKLHRPWHSFFKQETAHARAALLRAPGVGPETADALLLYLGKKPVFMADAYSIRALGRHGLLPPGAGYREAQNIIMANLAPDAALYGEYHALLVQLGKQYCRKNRPQCAGCPLQNFRTPAKDWPPADLLPGIH
jgi:endonuclease-3 related protein